MCRFVQARHLTTKPIERMQPNYDLQIMIWDRERLRMEMWFECEQLRERCSMICHDALSLTLSVAGPKGL